jgi:LysM repeat protein
MKRGAWVASTLMLVAIITSACNQPYSQPPVVTNTPIDPSSLFATPISGQPTEISDVQVFGTQTAQAANPGAAVTASPALNGSVPTATSTPFVSLPSNPTITPTATLALPSGPTSTSAPVNTGSRPASYTLQGEEFPYCIARRYNLDPDSLLAQNQLSSGTVFYAGVVLNLSNVTSPFPGVRALRPHPATYTVTGNADLTMYGVACKFGDLEPSAIVSANSGLSLGSTLTVGQTLNIP